HDLERSEPLNRRPRPPVPAIVGFVVNRANMNRRPVNEERDGPHERQYTPASVFRRIRWTCATSIINARECYRCGGRGCLAVVIAQRSRDLDHAALTLSSGARRRGSSELFTTSTVVAIVGMVRRATM